MNMHVLDMLICHAITANVNCSVGECFPQKLRRCSNAQFRGFGDQNDLSCILMTSVKSHKCSSIFYLLMIQIYYVVIET